MKKFALMREKLYTPVVGDILDELGYYHQFLPQDIRASREDMKLAGKAMTVLDDRCVRRPAEKSPLSHWTEALDQLKENGDIYCCGRNQNGAPTGELRPQRPEPGRRPAPW